MQSSARQRVKRSKCKCKPTSMEGSVPPRTRGAGAEPWKSRGTALGCQEAFSKRLHRGSLLQTQHVQKEGADAGTRLLPRSRRDAELTKWFPKATSTRTNVCQENTILPSQELLPSRNAVGCCKEKWNVHICCWCKLPPRSPALRSGLC